MDPPVRRESVRISAGSVKSLEEKLLFPHCSGKLEEEDGECGGRTLQACGICLAPDKYVRNAEQEKVTELLLLFT